MYSLTNILEMEIKIAKHAGFCFGVRRAVNIAEEEAAKRNGKLIYTDGPIIHNPQEVERLKKKGIIPGRWDDFKEGSTVIIRSHGIPPDREEKLKEKGLRIIDATCPYVKAVHEAVVKLVREGYFVAIVGEKNHPEVIGAYGYLKHANGRGLVIESFKDIEEVKKHEKVGVVSQTTQHEEFFKNVVGELALWVKELKVINTICNATSERQEGVYELAPQVDVMIIVGGKNSGNTRRLYNIAKSLNERSYHVETAEEIDPLWFDKVKKVGITAGASTPDWIIESVIKRIKSISKNF